MILSSPLSDIFPWMFVPTNRFQIWDLILFRHQFRRYVEHLLQCEICSVHNGILIVLEILTHEYCWFHCYSHKTFTQIIEFSSPSLATLEILFCLFRTWSFTRFTNDLDSTDNSNSVSSFPMMKFWGSCHCLRIDIIRSPWSITKCFSVTLRIARFRWDEFLRDQVELFGPFSKKFYSGRPDRSYVVASAFPLLRRPSTVVIQFWIICWREALHELLMVVVIRGFK